MELKRDKVARLYRDATAVIEPITPLNDMQIELDPGTHAARPLPEGGVLGVDQTAPVVPLSDLMRTLDSDTRTFLTSLIAALGEGVRGRGPDTRRMLRALGPTTRQAGQIARAAAERRAALSRLVHNLARVTKAASQDRELASLVAAGNQTLETIADQEAPLRRALKDLPPTLDVTRSTLTRLEPFARKLDPALRALLPSVRALPSTLAALKPFSQEAATTLRRDVRPFVREASPLAKKLAPSVAALTPTAPRLTRAFQILTYTANELAYNPEPGGKNQGFLFWLTWGLHNFNSVISLGDAHGGIGRAQVIANCYGAQEIAQLRPIFDLFKACPR